MKKTLITVMILMAGLCLNSCYYDKYNELDAYKILTNLCDSANVTYSKVAPVFSSYCVSCHNSGLANGGYAFDSYNAAKKAVNNNRLLGSVEHASGYQPMPPGAQLNACNIAIITNWVNSGAKP